MKKGLVWLNRPTSLSRPIWFQNACMVHFFFMHDMQDTSGSLLDPIENTNAQGSSKDPPALPPVPILSCQFFCMHIYIYIYIMWRLAILDPTAWCWKIWKSLLHAFMHDHSCSQPPQPFMHVKDQGSCGENYIPYLQSDNWPLPTTAGVPTYSRQKDGRRICHPGLSCIHCMHAWLHSLQKMHGYIYIYILTCCDGLHCMVGQVGAICWIKCTC